MKKYTRGTAAAMLYAAQKAQEKEFALSYATVYRYIFTEDGGYTWRLVGRYNTNHYDYTL